MFVQEHAWKAQKKLKAEVETGSRGHTQVRFRHEGKIIIQFGIRRASRDVGHGHLPREMQLQQSQCKDFVNCTLSLEKYIEILKAKGFID